MHMACQATKTSVMSPQKATKVMWYILGQLSSLQVSGRWPLVTGYWSEVRSKKPVARGLTTGYT